MAIELTDLIAILGVLKDRPRAARGRLLILGSAEVHIAAETYLALLLDHGIKAEVPNDKITPHFLGESLGFQTTETLDINGQAGITHDLMQPAPEYLLERYDLIIDAGVLFWCFNPGTALHNILSMLKAGGDVVHITAVSGFYGRGYYNIHPKLLDDFYSTNECLFLSATFRTRSRHEALWRKILNRASVFWRARSKNMFSESSDAFGHTYLRQAGRYSYFFSPSEPIEYLRFIPNDIIGVFAFRKSHHARPVSPLLL